MCRLFKFLIACLFIGNTMGLHDSVMLKDIESLTLVTNWFTTGRRSSPIPQLNCVGGSASHLSKLHPTTVQCYNRGSDGNDIQWECQAELDNSVKFGTINVVCEGFDYPDDPSILKGSCGLEYQMDYTSESTKAEYKQDDRNVRIIIVIVFLFSISRLIFCPSTCHHRSSYDRSSYDCRSYDCRSYGCHRYGCRSYGCRSYDYNSGYWDGYTMGSTSCSGGRKSYSSGGRKSYSSGTRKAIGFGSTRRR